MKDQTKENLINELEDLLYIRLEERVKRELEKRPNLSLNLVMHREKENMKIDYEVTYDLLNKLKS